MVLFADYGDRNRIPMKAGAGITKSSFRYEESRTMATQRDVISMLEDSGSQRLFASNSHIKYKLPNGRLFITSSTPSDHRSYNNAIALLRRELRSTHPEISQRFRTLPKSRRNFTVDDAIASKPIDGLTAIPGAQLVEAECEIVTPPPIVEPEVIAYRPSLKVTHDPKPAPGKVKTLTPDQLKEANQILASEGQAAMDAYLAKVRDDLCEVCKELNAERFPEPISPRNRVPENHTFSEEDEMSSILERARQELEATHKRIAAAEDVIINTQITLDADIAKRTSLETYIVEHEALASRAATLIAEVLPAIPLAPVTELASNPLRNHDAKTVKSRTVKLDYGMRIIEEKIYPLLRAKGIQEFNMDQVLNAIQLSGLQLPTRTQIQSWHFANLKTKSTQIVKSGPGKFAFKESING